MSAYSLDSQPYAVLDDPRRLQVVSLPGRQALLQRMTVDVGTGGVTPPDRLRVLARAEQDVLPVSALRVRVTDTTGVDLVVPQDISGQSLRRFRQWQFIEVALEPTVGFGSSTTVDVVVWFSVSERGPGWEIAAPNTGENVPEWRGPVDPVDPNFPVFGRLLTFPAGVPVLTRVSAAVVVGETGPVTAGEMVAGAPVLGSHNAAAGLRNPVVGTVFTRSNDAAVDGAHAYFSGVGNSNEVVLRKYTRDPFVWVNTINTTTSETAARSLTTDAGFGYIGTSQSPARLVKVNLAGNMTRVGGIVLNSGENGLTQLANDGTHVYGTTFTSPARVVKVRMSDLQRISGVTLGSGENLGEGLAISPDGTTLFVVTKTDPLRIVRVATDVGGLFQIDARVTLNAGENFLRAGVANSTHAFFATTTSPGRIVRVNLSTMARVDALTLGSGENSPGSAVTDGTHGYFGTLTSPGRVVKVNLSNNTRVGGVTLATNETDLVSAVTDGTHGYFGTLTSPGRVVKVNLGTLTRVGAVTLSAGEDSLQAAVTDGTHGYFATGQFPGRIVKVNLATMTRVGVLTLNSGENAPVSAITDGVHGYFGTNDGRIVKVNLATMARVGGLTLPSGENFLESAVISGQFGYFGTGTSPSKVVKVDLTTMTRVDVVTMDTNENAVKVAVTDGTHGYFGTEQFPGRVIKVDLAANGLGRTDAITYPTAGLGSGSRVDIAPDGTWGVVVTFGGHAIRFTTSPFQFTGDDSAGSPVRPTFRDVEIDSEGKAIYGVSSESPLRVRRWEQSGGDLVRRGERVAPSAVTTGTGIALDDRHVFVAPAGTATTRTARLTSALTVISEVEPVGLTNTPVLDVPYYDSADRPVGLNVDGAHVFVASVDGVVVKYVTSTGARAARFAGADAVTTLAADASHVYITEDASPSVVRKLDKTDLSSVADITLNGGEQVGERAVAQDATHLYYGTTESPARVVKVAKGTLARTAATAAFAAGADVVRAVAVDGTDLYAATDTAPIRVVKIDTATMNIVGSLTLAAGENFARAAAIETTGTLATNLFVLTNTLPARVVEVNLATFTRKTAVILNADETNGQVLLSDSPPFRLWAGLATTPGRVARFGETLASTGDANALQINSAEDAAAGLTYIGNVREDADVSMQFGQQPPAPEQVTAVVDTPPDDTGCLRQVAVSWVLPDDECVTVTDGGFVEVQRDTAFGWVTAFRVFDDVTRTVTDVEVLRNRTNRYRLRVVNDAGFQSEWTAPVDVDVDSDCCGYVFASNRFPDRSVWYDDLGERSYQFVEQVEYVEFEGRDGSVPLRPDADQLDEFNATLMVAGFGVIGGTTNTNNLAEVGRRLFRPLTNLSGGKRTTGGELLRPAYVSVTDNEGHQWFAEVEAPAGDVNARGGRYTLRVRVKEITRQPVPVELRATVEQGTGSPASDLPLFDPNDLLGS